MAGKKGGIQRRRRNQDAVVQASGVSAAVQTAALDGPEQAEEQGRGAEPAAALEADSEAAAVERIHQTAAALREEEVIEPKQRLSGLILESLGERTRNAAYYARGGDLSGLLADALTAEVERLEKEFNGGEPFRQRPQKTLKTGRKVA